MRFILLALVAACGSETDDRPATLSFITETILKPSCANAECHSAFKLEQGYSFSTVEDARATFQHDHTLSDLSNPHDQTMIHNLIEETDAAPRMPYDQPIPNADIQLIQKWLDLGLPGICSPGKTMACIENNLVPCDGDAYDLSNTTGTLCPNGCSDGACL